MRPLLNVPSQFRRYEQRASIKVTPKYRRWAYASAFPSSALAFTLCMAWGIYTGGSLAIFALAAVAAFVATFLIMGAIASGAWYCTICDSEIETHSHSESDSDGHYAGVIFVCNKCKIYESNVAVVID
jgi:hypothetical protein